MEKENDWIVANLNNPDFTGQDYQDVLGMTLDNTQLKSKDEYKKSKYIQDQFKNENGTFNEEAFDSFYNDSLKKYSQFQNNELIDNFEYSLFDTRADIKSKVRNPEFRFETVYNPDRRTIGVAGWNQLGRREWTPNELAQTQKIWDPETQTFLNETPNDYALSNSPIKYIKNLFADPLVLATYDQDGEHFDYMSGQMVKHKKGQYKMNEEGTYYTEKLAGRSPAGKQVVSMMDLITVDGQGLNKYDFFDSDSLDKSVTGTIMKNAVAIAPMFFSPVSEIYAGILIGRELMKTLPMLYGMSTSLFGNEDDSSILNTLAGYGQKFTGGTSEAGSKSMFNFEQIGNLVSDVALQWGQQKLISKAVNNLRGGSIEAFEKAERDAKVLYDEQKKKLLQDLAEGKISKEGAAAYLGQGDWKTSVFGQTALQKYMPIAQKTLQRNARLGADAALAYMALVSNYDVYNDLIDRGLTKKEASLVSLLSTAGMFSVDKYLGLGEMFFENLDDETLLAARNFLKEEGERWVEDTGKKIVTQGGQKVVQDGFWRKAVDLGRKGMEKIAGYVENNKKGLMEHSLSGLGKAIGEGAEEMSEEFVTDMAKQIYEWAGQLGADTTTRNIGAWDDAADRYLMSFFGGAVGGGIFYAKEQIDKARENTAQKANKDGEQELIYLLRQKRKDEIINEINKLKNKGEFGSTKLSVQTSIDPDGNQYFLTADDQNMSQNDFIANQLIDQVNQIDAILHQYNVDQSDDELFKQMVLGNTRLMSIQAQLNDASFFLNYRKQYQNLVSDLVSVEASLRSEQESLTDLQKRNLEKQKNKDTNLEDTSEISSNLSTLEAKRQEILQKLEKFKDGTNSFNYTRQLLAAANPMFGDAIMFYTFDDWCKKEKKRDVKTLSPTERDAFLKEYDDARKNQQISFEDRFEMLKETEKTLSALIQQSQDNNEIKLTQKQFDEINKLRTDLENVLSKHQLTFDSVLPDETQDDDSYKFRGSMMEGESEEQFVTRQMDRIKRIEQANTEYITQWENILKKIQELNEVISNLPDGALDPVTYRLLKRATSGLHENEAFIKAMSDSLAGDETTGYSRTKYVHDLPLNLVKKVLDSTISDEIKTISDQNKNLITAKSEFARVLELFEKLKTSGLTQSELEEFQASLQDAIISSGLYLTLNDDEGVIQFDENLDISDIIENISDPTNSDLIAKTIEQYSIAIDDAMNYEADLLNKTKQEILESAKEIVNSSDNTDTIIQKLNELISDPINGHIANELLKNTVNTYTELNKAIVAQLENVINKSKNINDLDLQFANVLGKLKQYIPGRVRRTDLLSNLIEKYKSELKKDIEHHPIYQFTQTLNQKLGDKNPLMPFIKAMASKYNLDISTVEELLSKLQSRYDSDSPEEFELSSQEIQLIDYMKHILKMTRCAIQNASLIPSWMCPHGHNKFVNDFAQDAQIEGFTELPTMDSDIAASYVSEISKYEDDLNNWIQINTINQANRDRKLIKCAQALTQTKLDFIKANKEAFMKTKNGLVDLITEQDLDKSCIEIEQLIASRLVEFLNANNMSFKDFLSKSKLIELCISDIDNLRAENPNPLDEKLAYDDNLSDYTKVQLLYSILANNSFKFEDYQSQKLETEQNVIPIAAQEHIIRIGQGFLSANEATKQFEEYILDQLGVNESNNKYFGESSIIPLKNALFICGVGGAGKTQVTIRKILDVVENDSDIVLTAPTHDQALNLKSAIGRGTCVEGTDNTNPFTTFMLKYVVDDSNVGEYSSTLGFISSYKGDSKSPKTNGYAEQINGRTWVDTGKIKIKRGSTPKVVVIDEITHISSFDIHLLNRWAIENDVKLIFAGDENQIHHKAGSTAHTFTLFKLSKLSQSLRESVGQVSSNNNSLNDALDKVKELYDKQNPSSAEDGNKFSELITNQFIKKIRLYYYDQERFAGTKLITSHDDKSLSKLKDHTVAFVGPKSSLLFNKLSELGITAKHFDSISAIEGSEFDYVVADVNWKQLYETKSNKIGFDRIEFLNQLYTLNSRGKSGIIMMDNGLSSIIEDNLEQQTLITYSGKEASFQKLKEFKQSQNQGIDFDKMKSRADLSNLNTSHLSPNVDEEDKESNEESNEEISQPEIEEESNEEISQPEVEEEAQDDEIQQDDEEPHVIIQDFEEEEKVQKKPRIVNVNTIRSYRQGVLGGFVRTNEEDGSHRTVKLAPKMIEIQSGSTSYQARIYRDLEIVEKLAHQNLAEGESLSTQQIKSYTSLLENIVRGIFRPEDFSTYESLIDRDSLIKILSGESTYKLHDGRTEGIYLEVSDEFEEGDDFTGLTDISPKKVNGKVYKYVLRFRPTTDEFNNLGTHYANEVSITLGFAADPNTWSKKVTKLQSDIDEYKRQLNIESDSAQRTILQSKIDTLTEQLNSTQNEINKYIEFLDNVDEPVKVKIKNTFAKLRHMPENKRYGTLSIGREVSNLSQRKLELLAQLNDPGISERSKQNIIEELTTLESRINRELENKRVLPKRVITTDYEQGWVDAEGKYIVKSQKILLGKDLEKIGFEKTEGSSGRVAVLMSPFPYKESELLSKYIEEKNPENPNCTVRLVLMDNAGVNWSSLTDPAFQDLYTHSYIKKGDGKESKSYIPWKRDAMGYRLFTSLWNWRANLLTFQDQVEKFKSDNGIDSELLQKIIEASNIIYLNNGKITPSTYTEEQLRRLPNQYSVVTVEHLNKLREFNTVTLKNQHIFRLGALASESKSGPIGNARGTRIGQLDVNVNEYFIGRKPESVDKVFGLYITEDTLSHYLGYVNEIFRIFSDPKTGISVNSISITDVDNKQFTFDEKKLITLNADRIASLSGQLTPLMQNGSAIISVEDSSGNKESIQFAGTKNGDDVGSHSSMARFSTALVKMFKIIKYGTYAYKDSHGEDDQRYKQQISFTNGDETEKISLTTLFDLAKDRSGYFKTDTQAYVDVADDLLADGSTWRFELGEMFDYMLHGTLEDVTTPRGRTNDFKISDALFKQGMFVDPDKGAGDPILQIDSSDAESIQMYPVVINDALLMTNTGVDLAVEYEVVDDSTNEEIIQQEQTEESEDENETPTSEFEILEGGILSLKTPTEFEDDAEISENTPLPGNVTMGSLIEQVGGKMQGRRITLNGNNYYVDLNNGFKFIPYNNNGSTHIEFIISKDRNNIDFSFIEDDNEAFDSNLSSLLEKICKNDPRLNNTDNIQITGVRPVYKVIAGDKILSLKFEKSGNDTKITIYEDVISNVNVEQENNVNQEANSNLVTKDQILNLDIQTLEVQQVRNSLIAYSEDTLEEDAQRHMSDAQALTGLDVETLENITEQLLENSCIL